MHWRALFFIDNQRFIGFSHKQKLSSIYRRTILCLNETSRVACNSGETQTRKLLLLFGRDRPVQNPDTSVARVGKL